MPNKIIQIAGDFWNIRGSFRVGGLLDIGTQASLIRRANGRFVFLDSYSLTGSVKRKIMALTEHGTLVEAVINLHPFHTIHVSGMHKMFPEALHFGTSRHIKREPGLLWQKLQTNDEKFHAMFANDFEFSVPSGVDFISANDNIHFSSVLAYHRGSKTIHADDTLMCMRLPTPIKVPLPGPLRILGGNAEVSFHPTLMQALEKRAGAAKDFNRWAGALIEKWQDADNLCAAHNSVLTRNSLKRVSYAGG